MIIAFLAAYLLGISIFALIDRRLSEISINMPQIVLPAHASTLSATVSATQDGGAVEITDAKQQPSLTKTSQKSQPAGKKEKPKTTKPKTTKKTKNPITKKTKKPTKKITTAKPTLPKTKQIPDFNSDTYRKCVLTGQRKFEENQYRSESKKITPEPNLKFEIPKVYPYSSTLFAPVKNYREILKVDPTISYYIDPKNMTAEQKLRFKMYAKFNRMTVKDYVNWLLLYLDEPEVLNHHNRKNLIKILRGEQLNSSDIPQPEPKTPPNAEQYFKDVFNLSFELPESDIDNPQVGYNSDRYAQFQAPENLKHLQIVNRDETIKKF